MKKIQKNIRITFLLMALAFTFVSTSVVFSKTASAQIGNPVDLVTCSGYACKWCDVFGLLQTVFNTAAVIVFPLVVIYIIYGAVLYIISSTSGSKEGLTKARATVTDAIIGLVLMLLTFIIVNATIIGITGSNIENFVKIDCSVIDTGGSDLQDVPPPSSGGGALPGPIAQGSSTEQEARDVIAAARPPIDINHPENPNGCPDNVNKYENCTSLAGMRDDTLNGIIQTNAECQAANNGNSCDLTINAGTEKDSHTSTKGQSHQAGYKVDLDRPNAALDDFIFSYCGKTDCSYGKRSDDNATLYYGPNNSIWANEGGHWDVTFP